MDIGLIFLLLCASCVNSGYIRRTAKGLIEDIGTVSRCFPKWYMAPPKWMRKKFKIKQRRTDSFRRRLPAVCG